MRLLHQLRHIRNKLPRNRIVEISAIYQRLGQAALDKNGQLNRAFLRRLIIESAEFKSWLEALMHPEIQKQLKYWVMTPITWDKVSSIVV